MNDRTRNDRPYLSSEDDPVLGELWANEEDAVYDAIELPVSRSGRTAEEVARLCAEEAGRIIMSRFRHAGRREQMVAKGRGNFVTQTDLAVEHMVLELLGSEYPGHTVLSEETAGGWSLGASGETKQPLQESAARGWTWIVDPLDGTHNFSQGIPFFAFNIALCRDGDPVLGLTYAPVAQEYFFAARGKGLTVNGEPATASSTGSVRESVLGIDLGYNDERAARLIALIADIWPGVQSVRVMGSAALGLAFAASGRYDVFVHHYLFPWDVAAGLVLVREGGGKVLDRDGGPGGIFSQGIVAGAPAAVEDFLRLAAGRPWR